jgi:hypothetical protein
MNWDVCPQPSPALPLPDGWTVELCTPDTTPNVGDWGKYWWAGPDDIDGYATTEATAIAIVMAIVENDFVARLAQVKALADELAALKEHIKQVEMYRDIFMRQREDFGDELDELNEALWKVRTRFIAALGQKQERPTSAIDSVAHILVLGDQAITELKTLREKLALPPESR